MMMMTVVTPLERVPGTWENLVHLQDQSPASIHGTQSEKVE